MSIGPHFTAWLVNAPSDLDGDNCDVTVLADEITSYDTDEDGNETPVWASNGGRVFYALTGISARDGDIDEALQEAKQLLAAAGWRLAGAWEAADNAYLVTVERIDEDEEWTLEETAARIGATSTGSARKMLSRWGVTAVRREPGRGGQSIYNALQVLAAKGARPGQGARTDLEDQ